MEWKKSTLSVHDNSSRSFIVNASLILLASWDLFRKFSTIHTISHRFGCCCMYRCFIRTSTWISFIIINFPWSTFVLAIWHFGCLPHMIQMRIAFHTNAMELSMKLANKYSNSLDLFRIHSLCWVGLFLWKLTMHSYRSRSSDEVFFAIYFYSNTFPRAFETSQIVAMV